MSAGLIHAGVVTTASKDKLKVIINVGIYAPFSNQSAFIGRNMLGAMEIASEQVTSSHLHYLFHTLDKLPDNPDAANILQKFIDIHHINVLLTEGSASGKLAAPLAKKNNIIHFCLANDSEIADGKNNFLAHSPNHQKAALLDKTVKPEFIDQFKQEYFSHPVTEAGYAYDIFQIIHNSAEVAMKTHSDFSSQEISTQLLAHASGMGVMGTFNLDKKGVLYNRKTRVV